MEILYVAFKGSGNSSNKIVRNLGGDKLFLTHSFDGIKRDIEHITSAYDLVYMFGLDKQLNGGIRIECAAQRGDVCLYSNMDCDAIAIKLNQSGIIAHTVNRPTQSLCNEAYWHMLRKCNCHVIFFHVPSSKYVTEDFIEKVRAALSKGIG